MRLILVRHALPVAAQVDAGRADPELSEIGLRQAEALGAVLGQKPITAVWASPLRRAEQTAAPTASALGLPVQSHEGLLELDSRMAAYSPDAIGQPDTDLARAYLAGDWSDLSDESPAEFHERVRACLDGIIAEHRGQTVAVFTHGGVINTWLAAVTGVGHLPIRWFLSDYGAINRFVTTGSTKAYIETLNERVDAT